MALAVSSCIRLLPRLSHIRHFCSKHPQDRISPPGRLRKYIVEKFTNFVEGYESFLEKRSPSAFKVYGTFKGGVHGLIGDTHTYAIVSKNLWTGQELHTLTRRELEIYLEMPKMIPKITPLLIISTVPGGFAIFPIAYFFPRHLLTHHFWTEAQKLEFNQYYHKHRLENYKPILDYIRRQASRNIERPLEAQKFKSIVSKLTSYQVVSVSDILELKPHFENSIFHMDYLSNVHVRHLAKVLNMSKRRSGLQQDGIVMLHADRAMKNDGLNNLSEAEVIKACLSRGLNPYGMTKSDQIEFLEKWVEISLELDENSLSLLLHCPVLLAYNAPTNRKLMPRSKLPWKRSEKAR